MTRLARRSTTLVLLAGLCVAAGRPTQAGDAAPPPPPARAQGFMAQESRVLRAMLKATGRVTLRYLEEKQDPEKAAAYEDILRALAGVTIHLEPGDERAAVAAGMKAMLEILPTMQSPKRAEVMRGVMATMAQALAEGLEAGRSSPNATTLPNDAGAARALSQAVLWGVADGVMERLTSHAFFGATLAAPGGDRPGFPVTAVRPGSRAERFGLRAGDRIVRVHGAPATWRTLLRAARVLHRDGEFPPLGIVRDGKEVELAPTPPEPATAPR